MASFVLALHDAGGTVPPMIAVAEALVATRVTVLGQPSIERRARAVGYDVVAFAVGDYATDVPLARDQPLNASRVEAVGAGVTVPTTDATPAAVRDALDAVLMDPAFRARAKGMEAASVRAGGASTVADDLERFIR